MRPHGGAGGGQLPWALVSTGNGLTCPCVHAAAAAASIIELVLVAALPGATVMAGGSGVPYPVTVAVSRRCTLPEANMSPAIASVPPSTMSPDTPWGPVTGSAPAPAWANWRIVLRYVRVPLRCTVLVVRPFGSLHVA